jgi:hypothetical protein
MLKSDPYSADDAAVDTKNLSRWSIPSLQTLLLFVV